MILPQSPGISSEYLGRPGLDAIEEDEYSDLYTGRYFTIIVNI